MSTTPTIADYMTQSPHSIAADRTLADAHAVMRKHRIRHLPVLDRGALVGLVSERDLALVETLRDVKPEEVEVEEAMSPDPYVVTPDTPLQDVAVVMWKKKYGSAVVMDGRELIGVFTTTDALRALITIVAHDRRRPRAGARRAKSSSRGRARAARS